MGVSLAECGMVELRVRYLSSGVGDPGIGFPSRPATYGGLSSEEVHEDLGA
jgi:hypothetical protein